MKKQTKKESKYITMSIFEKSMASIAHSFDKVFEKLDRHDKAFELILKELQEQRKEAIGYRMMMSSLNHNDVSQHRKIEGLEIRIEKLEAKLK